VKIEIKTIPHKLHPYPTVGDWRRDRKGVLHIKVSQEIGDEYAFLVALHELVEVVLCEKRGITCKAVDDFDKHFEARLRVADEEPGDDPSAPYRKEHFFATNIERLMAAELGVDWKKYEETINAL